MAVRMVGGVLALALAGVLGAVPGVSGAREPLAAVTVAVAPRLDFTSEQMALALAVSASPVAWCAKLDDLGLISRQLSEGRW